MTSDERLSYSKSCSSISQAVFFFVHFFEVCILSFIVHFLVYQWDTVRIRKAHSVSFTFTLEERYCKLATFQWLLRMM